MKLHVEVRTELEWLLDIAEEAGDETEGREELAEALRLFLEQKPIDAEQAAVLKAEFENHATKDVIAENPLLRREWNALMARAGMLDKFERARWDSGEIQCTGRRPKVCKVDGVEYEAAI